MDSTSSRIERGLCVALGAMFVPTGLQAALFPRSFFDDFPLGRAWIAALGDHYNEHLVRDVGGLFLALTIVSFWSWWRPALCVPVAVAWFVQGTWHLVFHVQHLDGLDGIDQVGMLTTLGAAPAIALVVLALDRRSRRTAR